MRGELIRRVDPWQAAREGRRVEGELGAGRLGRLAAVAVPVAPLRVGLDFEPVALAGGGADGAVRIVMRVDGVLRATCQRCLDEVELPLNVEAAVLVATEAGREALERDAEVVVAEPGAPIALAELVEDEVLLALPFAMMHEPGTCSAQVPAAGAPEAGDEAPAAPRENPFAVLEALRRRGDGDE